MALFQYTPIFLDFFLFFLYTTHDKENIKDYNAIRKSKMV